MSSRIDPYAAAKDVTNALFEFQKRLSKLSLEPKLLELVKIRASQINACAHCLEMHAREARAKGETNIRLDLISAWRESTLFDPRERAALAWTEALTNLAQTGAPDEDYERAHSLFNDHELVELTMAIIVINSWNRLNVGFRRPHAV